MRTCKDCKQEKPTSQFYRSKKVKGKQYYSSYCKPCMVERSKAVSLQNKIENYHKLWDYMADNGCVDCGETNPLKLSCDHTGEYEKHDDIGNMMKLKWAKVEAELGKCVVRCHNCHAVKTHASLGHFVTESLRDRLTDGWEENRVAYATYQAG